jgi:predicted metal-dependent enzyme (double-stranded beta helix superfamily)
MTDIPELRRQAVERTVDTIRNIAEGNVIDRSALERMKDALVALAGRIELFPRSDFPATGNEDDDTHLLSQDADGRFALYLYSSGSEAETPPHDHLTWAVIAGIEGVEHNRIFSRLDDGSVPGRGRIELASEFSVSPGTGLALMPEDVHSIHVDAARPPMHLHLYGEGFEFLDGRVSFDISNGTTAPYGGAFLDPATDERSLSEKTQ